MKNNEKNLSAPLGLKPEKSSYARKRIFKHGGYAIALTAIFVAVVIMLNIGATLLSKSVSLKVDLTANRDFSISEDNKEYIKDIERDVHIVVCSDKDFYKDSLYQYLQSSNYTTMSGSVQQFFVQNAYLLDEYDKLSDHITVEYADPQDPDFNKYVTRYPNVSLSIGSILVESTFELDGEEVNRYRVVGLSDIFTMDTEASETYGYNVISGNNIETALTSAIYTVTADRTFNVALVTANGGAAITNLQGYMEMNNYQFTEIKSMLTDSIPEDTDLVIISRPTLDYSAEELDKLDEYLKLKSGKRSTLMYIASASQSDLPNLNEFLDEWGFSVVPENTVWETSADKAYMIPSYVLMSEVTENGYTDALSRDDYIYIAGSNVPVIAKDPNGRSLKTILQISSTAVAYPLDAAEDFKAEDAEVKGPFVGVGISTESQYDDDNNSMISSVIMVSSLDLITTSYNNYAEAGNLELLSVVIDKAVDKDSVGIRFDSRTFETSTFPYPSEASVTAMSVVFVYVLPLAVLAGGVMVYIRRRRS